MSNEQEEPNNEGKRGKWLTPFGNYSYMLTTYQCSLCEYKTKHNSNYCPSCGARMKEKAGGTT